MLLANIVKNKPSEIIATKNILSFQAFWLIVFLGVGIFTVSSIIFWNFLKDKNNREISEFIEEKECDIYSLEESIRWFKIKKHSDFDKLNGCLLKEEISGSSKLKLIHCFIDCNNQPLMEDKHPMLIVIASGISQDLEKQFGDKSMLIFS